MQQPRGPREGDVLARLRAIHDRLADQESRDVLTARLDYIATGDPRRIISLVDDGHVTALDGFSWRGFFDEVRRQGRSRELIVYGAGGGRRLGLARRARDGASSDGLLLPQYRAAQAAASPVPGRGRVVLCGGQTDHLPHRHRDVLRTDTNLQYFAPDIVPLRDHEVIIDGAHSTSGLR